MKVLDLGSGAGANLQALAPLLPKPQQWLLVDNDPDLLARVPAVQDVQVSKRAADLATDLDPLFDTPPTLVTASAVFDLCGPDLTDAVVAHTLGAGAAFYTVLTYDGRESWEPGHPFDRDVLDAFHNDQRRDKGLGPALGPDATQYLTDAFRAAGYRVFIRSSDWDLRRPNDAGTIVAMANGHSEVASSSLGAQAADWRQAQAATTRWVVGHQDLLALPPDWID
ncbi:MAG: class I SAM-dependent methyltransferase [Pseudomonadota bacterium]